MAERFSVRPAFTTALDAAAFGLLALMLLTLPLMIGPIIPRDPVRVYQGMPNDDWGFNYVAEVLKSQKPIDILIVGASEAFSSIDVPLLKKLLAEKTGREPEIQNLGQGRRSEEIIHQILRDVTARRRVRGVVMTDTIAFKTDPHENARYILPVDVLSAHGLDRHHRLALYGGMVLAGPRQVWTQMLAPLDGREAPKRRQRIVGMAHTSGSILYDGGFSPYNPYETFRSSSMDVPAITPGSYLFDQWLKTANSQEVAPVMPPFSPFQQHFIRQTIRMLKNYRIPMLTLVVPLFAKSPQSPEPPVNPIQDKVMLRSFEAEPRDDETIVGLSQAALFPGLSPEQVKSFYANEHHFNRRGAEHFTRSLVPVFEKWLERLP